MEGREGKTLSIFLIGPIEQNNFSNSTGAYNIFEAIFELKNANLDKDK